MFVLSCFLNITDLWVIRESDLIGSAGSKSSQTYISWVNGVGHPQRPGFVDSLDFESHAALARHSPLAHYLATDNYLTTGYYILCNYAQLTAYQ
jgi:hypothetical protein